ncbi:cadherin-17 [Salarias fasciatus]|uniref:cadherin-17 n=1 Tax=Salarias fasciatus TaxID=181472 RepID=UPI001176D881|nr:cadherin-17 [Salarias fasciatus]
MTPVVHLLLLPLLCSIAAGTDLEEKTGPFQNIQLDVPEGTPVPYALYQFRVESPGVNGFQLKGDGRNDIKISKDGWLFLEEPLDWSHEQHFIVEVEALEDGKIVLDPVTVTINVMDVNNNAPVFSQSSYVAMVRENSSPGEPFTQVFASDQDDPNTPNAHLRYSLVSQLPNKHNVLLFQIDPETGEISTTEQGKQMLKARDGIQYDKGEEQNTETLKRKFDEYCTPQRVPYELNPFFTCVEKAEMRRRNIDPLEDPDFTLLVRVQDLGGFSETALSGNTRVHIVVEQNLWRNPGPLTIPENFKESYPLVIAKVQSNDPNALYELVQKEREVNFPFQIRDNGEIVVTEELDREKKDMYILVVFAKDFKGTQVDPPMEIQVLVKDVNDNMPKCEKEESVFELQENEPVGSPIGDLIAHDADEEGTLNSELTYTIVSQEPTPNVFSIDHTGKIQSLRLLQRKEQQLYNLVVRVSDSDFSADCKVVIKVIDVNNELPLFEKTDYGSHTLAEDIEVGHTVLNISATDADDPDSGSSLIQFHIAAGDDDGVFTVETDGKGVGHLVVAKPLDFESSPTYNLKIEARNPEPLMKGLEYGSESTASVFFTVTDVDEVPEFSMDIEDVTVSENVTKGSVLFTVEAKDPEGKEIGFKLDGDSHGWLEIDSTGEIKTKANLDRETTESLDLTITAFEKENPEKFSEHVVRVTLLDVNDNSPQLVDNYAFICMENNKPVKLEAKDIDSEPFSYPLKFNFTHGKKSHNWELQKVDAKSALLILKKMPDEGKTFSVPITVTDNQGMGVPHSVDVEVCKCTELGHCYRDPGRFTSILGMGPTVGILASILAFCLIAFIVVNKRNKKKNKKTLNNEEERDSMM